MAKVYDSNNEVSIAQDIAVSNTVYRAFARATSNLSNVNQTFSSFEILLPFTEGIIKRVILHKEDDLNQATSANLILTESQTITKSYKIAEYSAINFSEYYLDSEEEIYYSSDGNRIYAHVNVDGNFSTNLFIRLDIEKVN